MILLLVFEPAAISFRRRPTTVDRADSAPAAASHEGRAAELAAVPADAPEPSGAAPEQPAARRRAERIWQQHPATDRPLTGTQLARLAGISPRYSRGLLAEFRAQPDPAPAHLNGQPGTAAGPPDQSGEWPT